MINWHAHEGCYNNNNVDVYKVHLPNIVNYTIRQKAVWNCSTQDMKERWKLRTASTPHGHWKDTGTYIPSTKCEGVEQHLCHGELVSCHSLNLFGLWRERGKGAVEGSGVPCEGVVWCVPWAVLQCMRRWNSCSSLSLSSPSPNTHTQPSSPHSTPPSPDLLVSSHRQHVLHQLSATCIRLWWQWMIHTSSTLHA